ncbi:Mce-associated membrane protein [Mycobacterium sp. BK558]|nr:Mce-associated membrane protein [Mycobacterium sp. BK558]
MSKDKTEVSEPTDMSADVSTDVTDETTNATEADAIEETETAEETEAAEDSESVEDSGEPGDAPKRRSTWTRVVAFAVLPAIALGLALGAGYLKWRDNTVRDGEIAAVSSVQAAKDSTIALLSYTPDKVDQQLGDARNLLTGEFRDSYTSLTNDVVIPGAKQKQISAVATVPAAASVSASPQKAVVLVFVNQTVTVGADAPTDTNSSVRVTLEKVGDRWLISSFDPV